MCDSLPLFLQQTTLSSKRPRSPLHADDNIHTHIHVRNNRDLLKNFLAPRVATSFPGLEVKYDLKSDGGASVFKVDLADGREFTMDMDKLTREDAESRIQSALKVRTLHLPHSQICQISTIFDVICTCTHIYILVCVCIVTGCGV